VPLHRNDGDHKNIDHIASYRISKFIQRRSSIESYSSEKMRSRTDYSMRSVDGEPAQSLHHVWSLL